MDSHVKAWDKYGEEIRHAVETGDNGVFHSPDDDVVRAMAHYTQTRRFPANVEEHRSNRKKLKVLRARNASLSNKRKILTTPHGMAFLRRLQYVVAAPKTSTQVSTSGDAPGLDESRKVSLQRKLNQNPSGYIEDVGQ